jgi:hypothetical protein
MLASCSTFPIITLALSTRKPLLMVRIEKREVAVIYSAR